MSYTRCTDFELLARLIGKQAASRLYRGTLRSAFSQLTGTGRAETLLAVAQELMLRLMVEEMMVAPVFDPPTTKNYLRLFFAGREYESFVVIYLDTQQRLLDIEELFRGTLSSTVIHPREIAKRCLQMNCAALVLSHNHPSGVAEPSRADVMLTETVKNALALVDVRVLDHILIAGEKSLSFAEQGML